jgi:hypothetical protein
LYSFFFYLDIISTATLVLDLDVISEAMSSQEVTSSGVTSLAQLAKSGRFVRVIRLIRIIKLYKAAYEFYQARKVQKQGEWQHR